MIAQDTLTPLTAAYRYDALNRLRQKSTFKNYQNVLSYSTSYTYDKMGNILTLNRFASNAPMDSLRYRYYANSNKLAYVNDAVAAGAFNNDIDNQNPNNYAYDPTGNLIKDQAENLSISWTHYGKVKVVNKNNSPLLSFEYDATGNRLVKDNRQTNEKQIYIRDAQGNVMAVYKDRNDSLFLDELHLYGSSRLGMIKEQQFLTKKQTGYAVNLPALYHLKLYNFGKKHYELTDWLGNVRVVINDKKTPQGTNASDMTYTAQTISVSDYYPFGMLARSYSGGGYRFGFNTQERDDEIYGEGNAYTAQFWQYDARLGRRWNLDPITFSWQSTYSTFNNNPIAFNDPLGLQATDDTDEDETNGFESGIGTEENPIQLKEFTICGNCDDAPSAPESATKGSVPVAYKAQRDASLRLDYYKPKVEKAAQLLKEGKIDAKTYSMLRYQAQKATKLQQSNLGKIVGETPPFGKPLAEQKALAESIASGQKKLSTNAMNTRGSTTKIATAAKVGGRVLIVTGAAMSVHHIVTAENQALAISQEVGGWTGAWATAEAGIVIGAEIGSVFPGPGTAIGAFVGGLIGGGFGYFAGYEVGGTIYEGVTEE